MFPSFAAIWAQKRVDDPAGIYSVNAAARGHILEKYAIESYNKTPTQGRPSSFFHWDDCIIKNNGVGWSPDGLDIPQTTCFPELTVANDGLVISDGRKLELPKSFIEIKSYSADKHMKRMLTAPSDMPERFQMAVAFFILPSLDEGCLMFYSPDTDLSFATWYVRDDLKDEIALMSEMAALWKKNLEGNLNGMENRTGRIPSVMTEQEIYNDWIEERSKCL